MANKKTFTSNGEPKGSPLVYVRAKIKMVYAGHTIFPGMTAAFPEKLASGLIKSGLAEELDSLAPLIAALAAPRNVAMPRPKYRREGG
jgi:hypothetical protein